MFEKVSLQGFKVLTWREVLCFEGVNDGLDEPRVLSVEKGNTLDALAEQEERKVRPKGTRQLCKESGMVLDVRVT